jgi:zinc transporter, ZIP family
LPLLFASRNIPIFLSFPVFLLGLWFNITGSRRQALTYSFLSGVAEPVGALVGYVLLLPFLTAQVLATTLAFVAGIMVYISFDEILPMAHCYGREHLVILGVISGIGVMALSLLLLA